MHSVISWIKGCVCARVLSHSVVSDSVQPDGLVHQAPPSMEFFRQEYWSGLPFPCQADLPDPGMEPGSLALQADSLASESYVSPKGIHVYSLNTQRKQRQSKF